MIRVRIEFADDVADEVLTFEDSSAQVAQRIAETMRKRADVERVVVIDGRRIPLRRTG